LTAVLNPDKWSPIAKHLIWRCCKCGGIHRVKLKVVKGNIFIKEWKRMGRMIGTSTD